MPDGTCLAVLAFLFSCQQLFKCCSARAVPLGGSGGHQEAVARRVGSESDASYPFFLARLTCSFSPTFFLLARNITLFSWGKVFILRISSLLFPFSSLMLVCKEPTVMVPHIAVSAARAAIRYVLDCVYMVRLRVPVPCEIVWLPSL